MKATRRLGLLGSVALLACAPGISPVSAQDSSQATDNVLEEILVTTARKRQESIFDSPTSLTSFGETGLKALNVSNLDDVGKYVPNLNVSRFGVGNTSAAAVFIRGIGIQDHLITTDPGVGVYIDGVYLGRQMGSNLTLKNIERVEVLRGPQGTLYGRNTLGGAVNIVTRRPGDEEGVEVDATIGTRERYAAGFYANTRLSDNFAVSLTGNFKHRGGVGEAVNLPNPEAEIGEEKEFSGRVAALWDVSDDFSLLFAFDGVDNNSGQSPYTIEIIGDPVPGFGLPTLTAADLPADPDDLATTVPGIESTSSSGVGASVTAEWAMTENLDAKLIGSWRRTEYTGGLDDDATAFNLSEFPETGEAEQYSVELQVNGSWDNFDLVTGLFYFNEDGENFSGPFNFAPFNGAVDTIGTIANGDFFELAQETDAIAIYANGSYHVTEQLTIGGGLRYSDDSKEANALFPSFGGVRDFEEVDSSAVTWDANINYSIDEKTSVYATVARGYQTGGVPPRPFGGEAQFDPFDEVTAINYEIGFKSQITDNFLLLASAFTTNYNDFVVQVSEPQAGGFVTRAGNAAKARGRGFELETKTSFDNGFYINTSIGYLDAEIRELEGEVLGISVGDKLPLAPEWTISAVTGYRTVLSNGAELSFQADYSFRDDMFGQVVNSETELLEARDLFGFNIQYLSEDGTWSIDLYGENVFNEVYDQGRLNNTFHGFVGVVRSNDRSEFGLRFTKRFGGL
ncbi:TonB-dependent receptor [Kordiimonas laminariae]|uniref:TonB-dependent receptor n=1 Tax=Kordiimonas laminariae TaxID=2917717 RepID=UPI001FF196E1|nr:TonB-dependent receptor [Kordiimonas laminariae]MCK0070916.1 TonB-dependent receptor [Kordiimonas laminariae]